MLKTLLHDLYRRNVPDIGWALVFDQDFLLLSDMGNL